MDLLTASDLGIGFKLPVITLTLHYREGSHREQLSVQVLPHLVAELRALCARLLSDWQ